MSGIVDPSTPEREAREAVARKMVNFESPASSEWMAHNELLDAYAAAVRARALADVAGWVEGMENTDNPWRDSSVDIGRDSHDDGFDAACDALLAKLREAK